MPLTLPPLRLTEGLLLRENALQRRSLVLADGYVTKGPLPEIALPNHIILPGIIDLSGAPVGAEDLLEADRNCAKAGVTKAWMVHNWSWEHGPRAAERVETSLSRHDQQRSRFGSDLRCQLRVDTHLPQDRDRILNALVRHRVQYLTLANALRSAESADASGDAALSTRAARAGQSLESYRRSMAQAQAVAAQVPRHLCSLAEALDRLGIAYGSYADHDGATREYFRILGARIANAPVATAAAAMAKACNDPVLLPAGDLSSASPSAPRALGLVSRGLCDAIVSNGCPKSLLRAVWSIVDAGICDLAAAWNLVSRNPAEIMQIPDRGVLEYGQRADVVIVHAKTRALEATIAGGKLVYASGEAAQRLSARVPVDTIAA